MNNNNEILNKVNSDDIEKFIETYFVNDLIGENTKIVFVLESPHSDEIICKYPAAGDTGIAMSNKLIKKFTDSTTIPLGKYIFDNLNNSIFGIMNCCQIPMQASPYCYNNDYTDMLSSFKTIRNTSIHAKQRRNKETQELDNAILEDFSRRIANICKKDKKLIIIPCGKMAEYFIRKVKLKNTEIKWENIAIIYGIPHPAFNNWSKKKYRKKIKSLKKKIKETKNAKNN